MATLVLQTDSAGTGYFTLLKGAGQNCGSGALVKTGQDGTGAIAVRHGSLPLAANRKGVYIVRNLAQSTVYTVCFTADSGGSDLQVYPTTANFVTLAATDLTGADWRALGDSGFPRYAGELVFAMGADGSPYVGFDDYANNGRATVMRLNGTDWITVGQAGFSPGSMLSRSLAFAPDGNPYLAFVDNVTGKVSVMRFNGTAWVTVGRDNFSIGSNAETVSLAFAPDGVPYVAYGNWDGDTCGANVMKLVGTEWLSVGHANFSGACANYTALAFSPGGVPYVAYSDYGNPRPDAPSYAATVMQFSGVGWVNVGMPAFSADRADHLALAFAPDGTPHVAFQDYAKGSRATVMKYDGSAWVPVGSTGFSGTADYLSLAFAPDGAPYVAYQQYGIGKAAVMKFNGADWAVVGKAGFTAESGQPFLLAVGPEGTPYLAYQESEGNNSGSFTVRALESPTACLFDWAEQNFSGLFPPPRPPMLVWGIYTYRYYSTVNAYLGVSSQDGHVYYLRPDGVMQDVGPASYWLPVAGCQAN